MLHVVRRLGVIAASAAAAVWITSAPAVAADPTEQLEGVLDNARSWVLGILGAVVVLMLTIAGVRYTLASGDPSETERSKTALKAALLGFAIALLAPVLVEILKGILEV